MIRELQCCFCIHFQGGRNLDGNIKPFVCRAFPAGIPEPILSGEVGHTTPYPGDNGIRFEGDEDYDGDYDDADAKVSGRDLAGAI